VEWETGKKTRYFYIPRIPLSLKMGEPRGLRGEFLEWKPHVQETKSMSFV